MTEKPDTKNLIAAYPAHVPMGLPLPPPPPANGAPPEPPKAEEAH